MSTAVIIVQEKRARWLPELQRQFDGMPVTVKSAHRSADVRSLIEAASQGGQPALVLIDLQTGLNDALALVRWLAQVRIAGTVLIGTAAHSQLEPSLRELGATSVHLSHVAGHEIARECRSILQAVGAAVHR